LFKVSGAPLAVDKRKGDGGEKTPYKWKTKGKWSVPKGIAFEKTTHREKQQRKRVNDKGGLVMS